MSFEHPTGRTLTTPNQPSFYLNAPDYLLINPLPWLKRYTAGAEGIAEMHLHLDKSLDRVLPRLQTRTELLARMLRV